MSFRWFFVISLIFFRWSTHSDRLNAHVSGVHNPKLLKSVVSSEYTRVLDYLLTCLWNCELKLIFLSWNRYYWFSMLKSFWHWELVLFFYFEVFRVKSEFIFSRLHFHLEIEFSFFLFELKTFILFSFVMLFSDIHQIDKL